MGIVFRDGSYLRGVNLGKRTIKDGEAAVIWARNGRSREVIGPSLEYMFLSTIRFLTGHTAISGQYLVVQHTTGLVEHLHGPTRVFENPVKHASVCVKDGISLGAHECIMVSTIPPTTQRQSKKGNQDKSVEKDEVVRKIVFGPSLFIPLVSEVVSEFTWASTNRRLSQEEKTDSETFSVINLHQRTIPMFFIVKSSDGMGFDVSLELSTKITDVHKAANSDDPIRAIFNALAADLTRIGFQFPSLSIETSILDLPLPAFDLMLKAASLAGCDVMSVQIKSVEKPKYLRDLQSAEQQAKARHAAELEKAQGASALENAKVSMRLTRFNQDQQVADAEFEAASREQENKYKLKKADQDHTLALDSDRLSAELQAKRDEHEVLLSFLGKLKENDVDLTKYLTSIPWVAANSKDVRSQVVAAAAPATAGGGGGASFLVGRCGTCTTTTPSIQ